MRPEALGKGYGFMAALRKGYGFMAAPSAEVEPESEQESCQSPAQKFFRTSLEVLALTVLLLLGLLEVFPRLWLWFCAASGL